VRFDLATFREDWLPPELAPAYRAALEGLRTWEVTPGMDSVVVAKGRQRLPKVVKMRFDKDHLYFPGQLRVEDFNKEPWATARPCILPVNAIIQYENYRWVYRQQGYQPFWLAGMWRIHPDHDLCFAIVSQKARYPFGYSGDRMPCWMTSDEAWSYLDGKRSPLARATISLKGAVAYARHNFTDERAYKRWMKRGELPRG
jgi:putative SOS response-associated peptidase YedK